MVKFKLEIYNKTNGCSGLIIIKEQSTDQKIGIPIGDADNMVDVSKKAVEYLEQVKTGLELTIEIINKHIDTGCKKIPVINCDKSHK